MRAHPDVILVDAKEARKKFIEKILRDFLVNGVVIPFYEAAEIRTRSDVIIPRAGAEDLLTITKADQPEPVVDVGTLFNRIHAFFTALGVLEHLCLLARRRALEALKYLQELGQFRADCPGPPFIMAADRGIREKVFRLLSEQRNTYATYSAAPLEALANHKYIWNELSLNSAWLGYLSGIFL